MRGPRLFKQDHLREQYEDVPLLLQFIAEDFCEESRTYGVEPVVTRIRDAVACATDSSGELICESGVHPDGRAIDFRDEHDSGGMRRRRLYSDHIAQSICRVINERYARDDGKPTILHHSFNGGPLHFHCQVSVSQLAQFKKEKEKENVQVPLV